LGRFGFIDTIVFQTQKSNFLQYDKNLDQKLIFPSTQKTEADFIEEVLKFCLVGKK